MMHGEKNYNKVAIVSGGTRGIGRAISEEFANKKILTYALYNKNKKAADSIQNNLIIPIQVDITDHHQVEQFIQSLKNDGITINILINNAGITDDGRFMNLSLSSFRNVLETNFFSAVNLTKLVLPSMLENTNGRIIFISSINSARGQFGQTNYVSSKAAIEGFAKSLSYEVASSGITVNIVSPGYTETDMTKDLPEKIIDKIVNQIPCRRMGKPKEIAGLVSFLCDDNAQWINGANHHINGGQYIT